MQKQHGETVTGVELMQGIGARPAKGFWTDAWLQVVRRPTAVLSLVWIGAIAFFAAFAPLLANGHPMLVREVDESGVAGGLASPLLTSLSAVDILLIIGAIVGPIWLLGPWRSIAGSRSERAITLFYGVIQAAVTLLIASAVFGFVGGRDVAEWVRRVEQWAWFTPVASAVVAALVGSVFLIIPSTRGFGSRIAVVAMIAMTVGVSVWAGEGSRIERFDYRDRETAGEIRATYTLIPFSPLQGSTSLYLLEPMTTLSEALEEEVPSDETFYLGTDTVGQDVLSHMLHACRLSISVGFVSTSIAVVIGVTIGALMGYFGGWVDMMLFRLVEIFMAIPVLFLLVVAAAVLPRNTYVMMALIGCVTWTGSARFIRAEFMKLREQDFVQAARAAGLPLKSVLFRHMLPNGVTPVLVDASFGIALAIAFEATLSYLGLGPADQASWGRLLSSAISDVGTFKWWLAIFPGGAIFLTVLSYNLLGEALRDAIDPKLRKARV